MWEGYKKYDHHFMYDEEDEFFSEIENDDIELVGSRKKYLNIPCAFDIETSSKYIGDEKFATMYIWQLGINGSVILGRTWDEFTSIISQLVEMFGLELNKRHLIIYVHNLGYEFQWMRKYFEWDTVFSIKNRRPLYATTKEGIEFRCSLLLSNYALAYVGSELLLKYPVEKMVGDLDYSLFRHSKTPITDKELGYCINDVRVVMSYIQEKIEIDGDISEIPLTNTGYVRNYCREFCYRLEYHDRQSTKQKYEYRALMKSLSIKTEKEYDDLRHAFAGGFTHANAFHSGDVMKNADSADLCSSYPFTMMADYMPMSSGRYIGQVDLRTLATYCNNFCCLFTVKLYNLENSFLWESYISTSHCLELSPNHIANNGRLSSADWCTITITELDWDIIQKVYSFDEKRIEIYSLRVYRRGYLPKVFIQAILELYKKKTTLKGLADKVVEYMVSKNMVNASFGMAVTNIVRDEITYENEEWSTEEANKVTQLEKYNDSFTRFLFYPWGVWVTAQARHHLWEAIFEFGEDYVYADTDSIKGINFKKHEKFFRDYNSRVLDKLTRVSLHYHIPLPEFSPKTQKGERKMIGIFEREEGYIYFKTLGAKRYIYVHTSGELGLTTSGVNGKYALPYLMHKYLPEPYNSDEWLETFKLAYSPDPREKENAKVAMKRILAEGIDFKPIIEIFGEHLVIPPGYSGKSTLTYIDKPTGHYVYDYLGNGYPCVEKSSIHMEPASYEYSISKKYLDFISGIKEEYL